MALACSICRQALQSRAGFGPPLSGNSSSVSHSRQPSTEEKASVCDRCVTGTAGRNLQERDVNVKISGQSVHATRVVHAACKACSIARVLHKNSRHVNNASSGGWTKDE